MGYNSVTNNPGEFAIGVISQKNPEDISQFTVNIGSLGLAVDEKAYYMFGHDSVGLHVNSLTIAYIKANGIMYNSSTLDDTATSTSYFNYDSILANNTLYSESVSYSSDVTKLTFTMNLDQDNLYLKLTGQFSTYYFSTVKV